MAAAQIIHAILLSGGSAFGLDAAGGVQKYLEERGIGFDVGVTKVPLVCQSDLFDLTVGRMDVRLMPPWVTPPAWVLSTTITAMATMVQEQVLPLAKWLVWAPA